MKVKAKYSLDGKFYAGSITWVDVNSNQYQVKWDAFPGAQNTAKADIQVAGQPQQQVMQSSYAQPIQQWQPPQSGPGNSAPMSAPPMSAPPSSGPGNQQPPQSGPGDGSVYS